MSDPEVLTRIEGRVGRITLNRPAALHALTVRDQRVHETLRVTNQIMRVITAREVFC